MQKNNKINISNELEENHIWLSINEYQKIFHCSRRTIYRYIRNKKIKTTKKKRGKTYILVEIDTIMTDKKENKILIPQKLNSP